MLFYHLELITLFSNDQIVFSTPPTAGVQFFGVAYATTADLTRTLNYVIDSGSFPMGNGPKGTMTVDVTGIIESWTILADSEGNIEVDIEKCSFSDFPNFQSICGTERPTLGIINNSTARKNKDDSLSTWNTTVNAGDIFSIQSELFDQHLTMHGLIEIETINSIRYK